MILNVLHTAQSEEILCKIVGKRQEKAPIDLANYLGPQFSDHFTCTVVHKQITQKYSIII